MIRALLIAAALTGSHRSLPAFAGCLSAAPQVRPSAFLVNCADGTLFFAGMHWTRWDSTGARATGMAGRNDCTPDCRSGRVTARRVVVVHLYRARTCSNGRREFTRFMFAYAGERPTTFKTPFYSGAGCP